MMKIFKYELRRLLINKFFLALLVITGFFSYQTLRGDIIRGIAYTAPFSAWSYGAYMASVLPLSLITLLFFVTFLYSRTEKQVETITGATPVDSRKYLLVRCAAMLIGFLLITALSVTISLIFYARLFDFWQFGTFIVPFLLTVIPALLLVFGLGLLLGKSHVGLVYALMIVVLIASQVALPTFLDVFGKQFFLQTPLTLPIGPDGEPGFTVPFFQAAARVCIAVAGGLLVALSVFRSNEKAASGRL